MTLETRREGRRNAFLAACLLVLSTAGTAAAQPCLIFVHGKQTNTNTLNNWQAARDYWKSGSRDAVASATKNFAASYYVIGYNGTDTYWGAGAAGEVANEIVNATNGGPDGGGNRCALTFAQGGTFWVIGHSMAGPVMDFILGNNDATVSYGPLKLKFGSLASLLPRMKSMTGPAMLWPITQKVPPCANVRAQRLPPPSGPPFVALTITLATSPAAPAPQ